MSSFRRPEIVREVLPNGLTVLVQADQSHPLVAYHAVVKTGSATEGDYLGTGISHLLEHMLFKGTARRPVGAVESEARSYGGTTQGTTSFDTTTYSAIVNQEFWSEAADLLIDALFFPSLDAGEFAKEREVVLRELKLRWDDPKGKAWQILFDAAFRDHPYRIPVIGYEALVKAVSAEDLKAYHQLHYHPNNIVLGVAGDVDPQKVIERIRELTESIAPGRPVPGALPEESLPVAPQQIVREIDANLATEVIGFPGIALDHPDLYALDLLAFLLGSGRGSRLDKALKEEGFVHSVSTWNYTPKDPGMFVVKMRLDPGRMGEALKETWSVLRQAQEELLNESELRSAKKTMLRQYLESRQSASGQAADLAVYEHLVGDPLFASRYLEGVEQVTREDLRRVARTYLVADRATTVQLYPQGTVPEQAQPLVSQSKERLVKKVTLSNGIRLLMQADTRLPLVSIQASMFGGVRFETDQTNGISQLIGRMLLRGTRSRSADEIVEIAKAMGAQLAPFSGRNALGLSMEVMRSELQEALPLFAELLTEPTFPVDHLETERRLSLASLQASEESPFAWGRRRMANTLFTTHPYRLDPLGQPNALQRLEREDLARFYQQRLRPDQLVLSVVGDFDPAEVERLFEDLLGDLAVAQPSAVSIPSEPRMVNSREHQEISPRQEGLVMIGFQGLAISDPRAATLDLIDVMFSGGAGRLFSEVRERRGLAYTVGSFAIHGLEPGSFILYAVVDPKHLDSVREALLGEVQRLRSTPVSEKELQDAKQGLLGSRRIARQSYGAVASELSLNELYDLGFDFAKIYEAQVQAVTVEQIQALAQSLLDPQRCAVVVGRPKESLEVSSTQAEAAAVE